MRTVFLAQSGEYRTGADHTFVCETREIALKFVATWVRLHPQYKEKDVSDRHDGVTDMWLTDGGDWIEIREEEVKQ